MGNLRLDLGNVVVRVLEVCKDKRSPRSDGRVDRDQTRMEADAPICLIATIWPVSMLVLRAGMEGGMSASDQS